MQACTTNRANITKDDLTCTARCQNVTAVFLSVCLYERTQNFNEIPLSLYTTQILVLRVFENSRPPNWIFTFDFEFGNVN